MFANYLPHTKSTHFSSHTPSSKSFMERAYGIIVCMCVYLTAFPTASLLHFDLIPSPLSSMQNPGHRDPSAGRERGHLHVPGSADGPSLLGGPQRVPARPLPAPQQSQYRPLHLPALWIGSQKLHRLKMICSMLLCFSAYLITCQSLGQKGRVPETKLVKKKRYGWREGSSGLCCEREREH